MKRCNRCGHLKPSDAYDRRGPTAYKARCKQCVAEVDALTPNGVELATADLVEQIVDLRDDWQALAACNGLDPELFFPEDGSESVEETFATCAGCPVRLRCLEHALSLPEPFGIWGGTSPRTRKRILKERGERQQQGSAA